MKKPTIVDTRKITVDGKEYTLAELQALYDAIADVPGIKVKTLTVEKFVPNQWPNIIADRYPTHPYTISPTPNTSPGYPYGGDTKIWCHSGGTTSIGVIKHLQGTN